MGKGMVVDDEVGIYEVLEKFLTAGNLDVYTALDGPTAGKSQGERLPERVVRGIARRL